VTVEQDRGVAPGGTLYVVATPIGNLGDVTLRALDVLRSVPLIAAEDTRIARRLLDRYEIRTKTVSYHVRSGPGRLRELLGHLEGGADLALVTDAGTPAISDPGEELVARWADAGGVVIPIPGPSAVIAAISATGIAGPHWTFEGFLPRSGRQRHDRLARIAADERGAVLYEAPGRLDATLRDLALACGGDRPSAVCRELTKLHEQIVRGSLDELAASAADGTIHSRGEVVVVVGSTASPQRGPERSPRAAELALALAEARAEVERLVAGGAGRAAAARRVAAARGLRRRDLYQAGKPE
jgi:16S rRNA (cytidine1402-2'-O)-methyltransferase